MMKLSQFNVLTQDCCGGMIPLSTQDILSY